MASIHPHRRTREGSRGRGRPGFLGLAIIVALAGAAVVAAEHLGPSTSFAAVVAARPQPSHSIAGPAADTSTQGPSATLGDAAPPNAAAAVPAAEPAYFPDRFRDRPMERAEPVPTF